MNKSKAKNKRSCAPGDACLIEVEKLEASVLPRGRNTLGLAHLMLAERNCRREQWLLFLAFCDLNDMLASGAL